MKYNAAGSDSVSLQGIITALPSPFNPTGKTVSVNITGATAQFTLDARGRASSATGSFQLLLKAIRTHGKNSPRTFNGGDVAFKAKLVHGSWSDLWAPAGVDRNTSQNGVKLNLNVAITIDGTAYAVPAYATITSKAKVGGKFR
jgi:hypothetical protein